jgi:DNA-directed RNA polymerase subunit RPC12/RpoP
MNTPKLIPHDGCTDLFVCRPCLRLIDPVGTWYEGYTDEAADEARCPYCGSHDTAWLFAPETQPVK